MLIIIIIIIIIRSWVGYELGVVAVVVVVVKQCAGKEPRITEPIQLELDATMRRLGRATQLGDGCLCRIAASTTPCGQDSRRRGRRSRCRRRRGGPIRVRSPCRGMPRRPTTMTLQTWRQAMGYLPLTNPWWSNRSLALPTLAAPWRSDGSRVSVTSTPLHHPLHGEARALGGVKICEDVPLAPLCVPFPEWCVLAGLSV